MIRSETRSQPQRAWRVFSRRDGSSIGADLRDRRAAACPLCGHLLEARRGTRCSAALPLGARGYDLDCRDCRRFWLVVQHTPRSIRILRMRRFIAAVQSTEVPLKRSGTTRAAPEQEVTLEATVPG